MLEGRNWREKAVRCGARHDGEGAAGERGFDEQARRRSFGAEAEQQAEAFVFEAARSRRAEQQRFRAGGGLRHQSEREGAARGGRAGCECDGIARPEYDGDQAGRAAAAPRSCRVSVSSSWMSWLRLPCR